MVIYGILIFIILSLIILNLVIVYRSSKRIEYYESIIVRNYELTLHLQKSVKELDDRELFQKDDEVGGLFEQIKTMIDFHSKLINEN